MPNNATVIWDGTYKTMTEIAMTSKAPVPPLSTTQITCNAPAFKGLNCSPNF